MTIRYGAYVVLPAAGFAALAWLLSRPPATDEPRGMTADRDSPVESQVVVRRRDELADLHISGSGAIIPLDRVAGSAEPGLARSAPHSTKVSSDERALPAAMLVEDAGLVPVPLNGAPEGVRKLLLWAAADPAAAAMWADQRADSEQRTEALQDVCFKIAEGDPRAAVDLAESFGLDDDTGLVENLVAQWAAKDPAAALAWAARRPPGDVRDQLTARVAFVVSASDPVEAARLIEAGMTPGALQADAAAAVMQSWASRDAPAAAAWARSLPPSPVRARALRELAGL